MYSAVSVVLLLLGWWFLFRDNDDDDAAAAADGHGAESSSILSETELLGVTKSFQKDGKRWYIYSGQRHFPKTAKYVMIDTAVHTIKDGAFKGHQCLLRVYIPRSVRTIGKEAFEGCTALGTVRLEVGLKAIGEGAFFQCLSLRNIVLPPGLESIGNGCFCYCRSLRRISIPLSLATINDSVFNECHSLVEVNLHKRLKVIGPGAFGDCKMLQEIELPDGLETIKHRTFEGCTSLQSIAIPETVELIDTQAFDGCTSLTAVKLGKQGRLKVIGPWAFHRCLQLESVELSKGLILIAHHAFHSCVSLQTMSIPGLVETIEEFAFGSCRSLIELNLQDGIKTIGVRAFAACSELSSVAFPISLKWVRDGAFADCQSLLGVEIPAKSDMVLDDNCFRFCHSLVNISIPSSCDYAASNNILEGSDLLVGGPRWRDRFEGLPIHKVCYHSTPVLTKKGLIKMIQSQNVQLWEDAYGLTPLHLIATSTTLRHDIMECLIDSCPEKIIWHQDFRSKTMMDYILRHTSQRAVPLIKMVLYKLVVERVSSWDFGDKWRAVLSLWLETMQNDHGFGSRCDVLEHFFDKVGCIIRIEVTSLMELALWKMRMNTIGKEDQETSDDNDFRRRCRFQSGAGVVIENVMEYLWHGESETHTGLSMFPSYHSHSQGLPLQGDGRNSSRWSNGQHNY